MGLVVLALPALSPASLRAADGSPLSDQARTQMLKDFKRTGLNTTPGDAMLLRILVESSKARRGVEVGSATGFGALNMGWAFERNGGRLITVDIDSKMVAATRENVRNFGLEKTVQAVEGDALQVLPKLEGEFDFVFIDAMKKDYFKYFKALEPKLKAGAVVVADNVIKSEKDMKDFLDYVQNSPNYDTVIIRSSMEKGDGMSISYKIR
jgi:caffeoyl-CoA O-methyltransferase